MLEGYLQQSRPRLWRHGHYQTFGQILRRLTGGQMKGRTTRDTSRPARRSIEPTSLRHSANRARPLSRVIRRLRGSTSSASFYQWPWVDLDNVHGGGLHAGRGLDACTAE